MEFASAGYRPVVQAFEYEALPQLVSIYADRGEIDLFAPVVNQVILKGEKLARQILEAGSDRAWNRPKASSPVNFQYVDNSWNWSSTSYYGGQDERNQGNRMAAGVLFTIGSVVTAYFIGTESKRLKDATNQLEKIEARQQSLATAEDPAENDCARSLHKVLNAQHRIFSSIKDSAQMGLALKMVLGGAMLLTGLSMLVSSSGLVVIGLVGTVLAGIGLAIKSGYEDLDKEHRSQARLIKREVQWLNEQIEQHEVAHALEEPEQSGGGFWGGFF